jgi:hypothetical protein
MALILIGGIILVIFLPRPANRVYPQDVTPPPPVALGVAALPFSDTFDTTADQWRADGAWRFDEADGYTGGGWTFDGAQANQISALEYTPFIDLHGDLGAQIMFRQRGSLPASDLIAVEISLDGGATWFIVDSQAGFGAALEDRSENTPTPPAEIAPTEEPENADGWTLHQISLSDYRNQVIRLRFRAQTGVRLPGAAAQRIFYQIDNLSIQYVADATVLLPVFPGPRTLLGLHLIVGARPEPVIELAQRMVDAGWPLGTIKGTSGTETILAEVKRISPQTITVYRSLETPRGLVDCPDSSADPVAEARAWMSGLWGEWQHIGADYYEIMNECLPPTQWLVPFSIEAMRLASERGYCLLVFSFAVGNPEPEQYAQLLPVYDYALRNPCRPGWAHGIALHAYGAMPAMLLSDSGLYLGLRHRLYYADLLQQRPEAARLPVFITEAGPGDDTTSLDCATLAYDMIRYTQQIESDPYVAGFHLWNVGPADSRWVDVSGCLPTIGDALLRYYTAR